MSYHKTGFKIFWYLKRLKKMPLREIPYRINQFLRIKQDKFFFAKAKLKYILSENAGNKFQEHFGECSDFNTIFTSKEINGFLSEAESILQHKFDIFGIVADFGNPVNTHLDIKTGKTWPLNFWDDIDYRDGNTVGGIKFAWEFNRLNHLPILAVAYLITKKNKYLLEIFTELDQWLKANPYPFGINWISGIESGIRLVNLFYALKIIGRNLLKEEQEINVLQFVWLNASHLYRYPSKYSSSGNHALAEALGLFVAGTAFPCLKGAHKWKTFGKKVLEREVLRQIYPDGSSFEHTIPYLQFVADHFLIYYLICKEYNEHIDGMVEERLKAICKFISNILDIKGNIPMIGDDDDGFLLKLWSGEHNNFLSLLNTCAILFKKPEWIHPAAGLDTKTSILIGNSAEYEWKKLKNLQGWQKESCYFKDAGLAVISDNKSEKEIMFVGHCGAHIPGEGGGHRHADALSFCLSVNGQLFFVDPGTYLYHSGGRWRKYFRSTVSHNTVEIDDKDQVEQIADFMFDDFYHIHNVQFAEKDNMIIWTAEHDGYNRLSDPVIHQREVIFDKEDKTFIIIDRLKCKGKHKIKLLFHVHPDVKVISDINNSYQLTSETATLVLQTDKELNGNILYGMENPLTGWYSSRFNRLDKTNTIIFTKTILGDSVVTSRVSVVK